MGPRGGVVTQRSAKPFTPVQFWSWPPLYLLEFADKLLFPLRSTDPSCYRIATIGLSFFKSGLHGALDGGNCILLHPRNHVAVKVQRDADLAVSQSLACGLWVHAIG